MVLYCSCGHPILVVGHWDGKEISLSLRDGMVGKDSPPLTTCPRCSRPVEAGSLDWLPPVVMRCPPAVESDLGHSS